MFCIISSRIQRRDDCYVSENTCLTCVVLRKAKHHNISEQRIKYYFTEINQKLTFFSTPPSLYYWYKTMQGWEHHWFDVRVSIKVRCLYLDLHCNLLVMATRVGNQQHKSLQVKYSQISRPSLSMYDHSKCLWVWELDGGKIDHRHWSDVIMYVTPNIQDDST